MFDPRHSRRLKMEGRVGVSWEKRVDRARVRLGRNFWNNNVYHHCPQYRTVDRAPGIALTYSISFNVLEILSKIDF